MENQANRPHRKTEEKKQRTSGMYYSSGVRSELTQFRSKSKSLCGCGAGEAPEAGGEGS